ncbi:hypothetical protein MPSEU_000045700 [Mayamaea pseudoterrestris]|nr:hypothetical protein MPSEU_000045700 [Mayamaea pseudoterrestris]
MGRITLYSADNLHSEQAKKALETRNLPYLEINLQRYPQKKKDLVTLAGTLAVPQAFFNTRLVGDLKSLMQELKGWDTSTKYKSPRARYDREIAKFPDPMSQNFLKPDTDAILAKELPVRMPASPVKLPDGTTTTVNDITMKLYNSLPRFDATIARTTYANCFSGEDLRSAFEDSMALSEKDADEFCNYLVDARIMHHLGSRRKFAGRASHIYRLQCLMAPDVLNTYCFWSAPVNKDVVSVVEVLMRALAKLERDALVLNNYSGKVDYGKIKSNILYNPFQEAVCELQESSLQGLAPKARLATCLNIFNMMLRFAFIRAGFPTAEDVPVFLSSIKFKIQGHVFTLQEWVDGVLRGNRKSGLSTKLPFAAKDPRKDLAFDEFDNRVHFALSCGFGFGSKTSLPFDMYTGDNINEQLDIAAQIFADDNHNILVRDGAVYVHSLFDWYRTDYPTQDKDLLAQLTGLMSSRKRAETQHAASTTGVVKLQYMKPNWTENAQNFDQFDKKAILGDISGFRAVLRRFKAPRYPSMEAQRLDALEKLNVLDTIAEERFDRITSMVQREFDLPIVLVSLVDEERQWFKSAQWKCDLPKPSETGRDISFCGHAILGKRDEIFVIPDATKDERFADNPLVTGDLNLRFYAGVPLDVPTSAAPEGYANIGTLCIIDQKPRVMTDEQLTKLLEFAQLVKSELVRRGVTEIDG